MNQVYEEEFEGFSYGFRPGRKQHDALDALWAGITTKRVNWVLDADIKGFFDHMDHGWLMKFVEHLIADRRVLALIRKWLTAGVSEDGEWSATEVGTPQGAVISPLLANVYLHYVLDRWIKKWRKGKGRGNVIMVRWADGFIVGFQHKGDAETFDFLGFTHVCSTKVKNGKFTMRRITKDWIPAPRILHPYPPQRSYRAPSR